MTLYVHLKWIVFMILFGQMHLYSQNWTDQSFEDFSKGELGSSGQNIYISNSGEIKTIRRYDVNKDGFIDLMFNNTHDQENYVDASVLSFDQNSNYTFTELPVEGSLYTRSADLNKDGFPDLVFCPNKSGIQHPRRFLKIYWGSKEGWSSRLSNGMLPVNNVTKVEIGDINGDTWPDIITLNAAAWLPNQPQGQILRIYWGGEHSFQLNNFKDIGIEDADHIVIADLDADGFDDVNFTTQGGELKTLKGSQWKENSPAIDQKDVAIAVETLFTFNSSIASIKFHDKKESNSFFVLTKEQSLVKLVPNQMGNWVSDMEMNGVVGSNLVLEDLDQDGYLDFVLTNFEIKNAAGGEVVGGSEGVKQGVEIIWGQKNKNQIHQRTLIPLSNAIATNIGDFNQDGTKDIVVAVFQGKDTYLAQSQIILGKGNRKFENSGINIPTQGAYDVCVVDAYEGVQNSIIFSNSMGGVLYEGVPLYLYMGSESGFSEDEVIKIPFTSGYESTAADVNDDGYVDIMAVNSMHGGGFSDTLGGVNIYLGSDKGFDFEGKRAVLREINASTSNIADLNKDGYLDILVGFFDQQKGNETGLVIYYGDASGFHVDNRQFLTSPGRSSSPMIADFDKDGWLDVVVSSYSANKIRIFKGSKDGFKEEEQVVLPMYSAIDIEVADLNDDGFLDIIVCHYKDHVNAHHDLGMTILWGDQNGFENWRSQWLPSYTPLGPVVADFDNDGFLDIFAPAYHGDISRENLPMYLYWGSPEGYSVKNRKDFIGDSGTDALAADFDRDGQLDLAVAHHTIHGSHAKAKSTIYYNDGKRFSSKNLRTTDLPSPGVHWMWNKDMGNVYNRSWTEEYTSRLFSWDKSSTKINFEMEASQPEGGQVIAYYRSSPAKRGIEELNWKPVKNAALSIHSDDRYFQYKIDFVSSNGDQYPALKSVHIEIE